MYFVFETEQLVSGPVHIGPSAALTQIYSEEVLSLQKPTKRHKSMRFEKECQRLPQISNS